MVDDYLPEWATAEEACDWLARTLGETWTLPRLLEHGIRPSVWVEWSPNSPAELFGDRREGFRAHFSYPGDTQRLAFDRTALLTMTVRPWDGVPIRFSPGIKVVADDLRFAREAVQRVADRKRASVRTDLPRSDTVHYPVAGVDLPDSERIRAHDKPRATIQLPAGTEWLKVSEVPDLLANAMHPPPTGSDAERWVTAFHKNRLDARGISLGELVTDEELAVMRESHPELVGLKVAMPMDAWERLAPAANSAIGPGWTIYPVLHEPSLYKAMDRIQATDGYRANLRKQYLSGALTLRNPHTKLKEHPRECIFHEALVLSVSELAAYLERVGLGAIVEVESEAATRPGVEEGPQRESVTSTSALGSEAIPRSAPSAVGAPHPLTTRDLASAFAGIENRIESGWYKLLGNTAKCKWAASARIEPGARGKRPATWNPVAFALLLEQEKSIPRSELKRRFRTEPKLANWRKEWGRRIAELEAFGLDTNDRQR